MKRYLTKISIQSLLIFILLIVPSAAQVNLPDSLLIGNPKGLNIIAGIGQQAGIPIWIKTDDTVVFISFSIATSDQIVSSRDDGVIFRPLALWSNVEFLPPVSNHPSPGFTSQEMLGVANDGSPYEDSERYINTNYKWLHIADYFVTINFDSLMAGEKSCMVLDDFPEAPLFVMSNGIDSESPGVQLGCLELVISDFIPGDANSSGMVNSFDVIYLRDYLMGLGPPPVPFLAGDANGDCRVNGLDITYLRNYLRSMGSLPRLGDCD